MIKKKIDELIKKSKQKIEERKVNEGNKWHIEKSGRHRFSDLLGVTRRGRERGKGKEGRVSLLYIPIFQDPL